MEILVLLIVAGCIAGAFVTGLHYGADAAYDEALEATAKVYEEIYKECKEI